MVATHCNRILRKSRQKNNFLSSTTAESILPTLLVPSKSSAQANHQWPRLRSHWILPIIWILRQPLNQVPVVWKHSKRFVSIPYPWIRRRICAVGTPQDHPVSHQSFRKTFRQEKRYIAFCRSQSLIHTFVRTHALFTMPIRGGTIINIAGTTPVDDPEYRYKMPAVYGKIEGSGNGIKTVIPNITDVATSLHRSPGEVNKFFGCELGAQTTYNEDTDRAVVNGAHTDDTLQKMMHKYIEGFVICPNCGLVRILILIWIPIDSLRSTIDFFFKTLHRKASNADFFSFAVFRSLHFLDLSKTGTAWNQIQYQKRVHLAQMCRLRCQRNGRYGT